MKNAVLLGFLLLAAPTALARADENATPSDWNVAAWQANGVEVSTAPSNRTRLEFEPNDWPNVRFVSPTPRDWKGKALSVQIFNPSDQPVEFFVRADEDAHNDGWHGCQVGKMTALPRQLQRFLVVFNGDPMRYGMRALPPVNNGTGDEVVTTQGAAPIALSHIMAWQLFVSHPAQKTTLEVGALSLVPAPDSDLKGIVDGFGQYAKGTWPGKIGSLSDLKRARVAEEASLAATPPIADRDRFGGWTKGMEVAPTGWFGTHKEGERWWLTTPEGHPFWSMGVDAVLPSQATITTGREEMFASLPSGNDPFALFKSDFDNVLMGPMKGQKVATYDFASANLYRKYGNDVPARWAQTTLARLHGWGFNTIGNWSDDAFHNRALKARVPYTATVDVWGDFARVSSGDDYWGQMPDPFDAKWAATLRQRTGEVAAGVKDDPYCIGYFVNNELSWGDSDDANFHTRYGLALGALNAKEADSPAKRAFLDDLKRKYPTIEALNAAWKSELPSWDALNAPWKTDGPLTEGQKADFSAFLTHFADQYFQTVRDTLHEADANHLYLGCRFAWKTPEAVASANRFCDVVSFNIYQPRLDASNTAFMQGLSKPVIIGEFHMGATDRGMFHPGLVAAHNQAERAQMFSDYLQSAARMPSLVGAHWFQWSDEPTIGRSLDGESYGIGLVSVTDTPYPELVASARQTSERIYDWHAAP